MKTQTEKDLLQLLEDYYHYKYMTAGFFSFLYFGKGVSLNDFREWLNSRS